MTRKVILLTMLLAMGFLLPALPARAHCDTLDGPVVADARTALANGVVTPVLKWVTPEDEREVRHAFTQTLAVRRLSPAAEELADRYFFETLVRVHRAGEGAPYTGLKPAGTPPEPGVTEADTALAAGKVEPLVQAVTAAVADGIEARFTRVAELKKHANDSVTAGREYVEAYVEYMHYVENLLQVAGGTTEHQAPAVEAGGEHHH
jgi:hypothetical protein